MASLTFSPTQPRRRQTVTVTGSGFSASTSYTVVVTHQSVGSQTIPVTTDGAGGFTCSFVANGSGTAGVVVNTTPATVTQAATGSVKVSGD